MHEGDPPDISVIHLLVTREERLEPNIQPGSTWVMDFRLT
jgi:hypothetical protein